MGLTKDTRALAPRLADLARQTYDHHRADSPQAHRLVAQLDAYLEAHEATHLWPHSPISLKGWTQRLGALAEVLSASLDPQPPPELGARLRRALEDIQAHQAARLASNEAVVRNAHHAARLAFKLAHGASALPQDDPAHMARVYVDSSSFEDLIRANLVTFDFGHPTLQQAVGGLLQRAAQRRAQDNARFARGCAPSLRRSRASRGAWPSRT